MYVSVKTIQKRLFCTQEMHGQSPQTGSCRTKDGFPPRLNRLSRVHLVNSLTQETSSTLSVRKEGWIVTKYARPFIHERDSKVVDVPQALAW